MSVLFVDGFDHYATGDLLKKWDAGAGNNELIYSGGRFGGSYVGCWRGTQGYLMKVLSGNKTTLVLGCAFRWAGAVTGVDVMGFLDGTTVQVGLYINSNLNLEVRRGNGTLIAGPGTTYFGTNSIWRYVELLVTFHGSTGVVTVNVDGVQEFTASGLNTSNSGNAYANRFYIGNQITGTSNNIGYYDDLYVVDTAGSRLNGILGPRRVTTLLPTGAGSHTQWTPNTGSNYAAVNENPPNGDTTYVASSTVGQIDSYAYADLPASQTVVDALQFNHYARKDDVATRQIAPFQRNGSAVEAVGATSADLPSSYNIIRTIAEQSLSSTGSNWTPSEVNASEFGTEVIT